MTQSQFMSLAFLSIGLSACGVPTEAKLDELEVAAREMTEAEHSGDCESIVAAFEKVTEVMSEIYEQQHFEQIMKDPALQVRFKLIGAQNPQPRSPASRECFDDPMYRGRIMAAILRTQQSASKSSQRRG